MKTRRGYDAACWLCDYGVVVLVALLVLLIGAWRWGESNVGAAPVPVPTRTAPSAVPPNRTPVSQPSPSVTVAAASAQPSAVAASPSVTVEPSPTEEAGKPDFVLVFVPVKWESGQDVFESAAQQSAKNFVDASHLERYFTPKVVVLENGPENVSLSSDTLLLDVLEYGLLKQPGDRYIGLTDGDLVMNGDSHIAGWTSGDQAVLAESFDPYIVAHELGHTFGLCDEYSYGEWSRENAEMSGGCPNPYPATCSRAAPDMVNCFGDPTGDGGVSIMGPAGSFDPHGFNEACLKRLETVFAELSGGELP